MAKKKLKRNKGGEEEGEEDRGEDRDPLPHHHLPLTTSAMLSRYHIVRLVLPKRLTEGGWGAQWPEQQKQAVKEGVVVAMAAVGDRQ